MERGVSNESVVGHCYMRCQKGGGRGSDRADYRRIARG